MLTSRLINKINELNDLASTTSICKSLLCTLVLSSTLFSAAASAENNPIRQPSDTTHLSSLTEDSKKDATNESKNTQINQPLKLEQRISLARQAFAKGDYPQLYTLLDPIASKPNPLLTAAQKTLILPWYATGLVVVGQQQKESHQREIFFEKARTAFVNLLKTSPDYQLEELLYPDQVVILFNATAQTIKKRYNPTLHQGEPGPTVVQPVYIEKEITKNQFALVFFPFGIGEFQNGDLIKGTLSLSLQVAAIVTNISSFIAVEKFRGPLGYYSPNDFRIAKAWRTTMYASLGIFLAAYIASVIDAWVFYKPYIINIRTLDAPPPELQDASPIALSVGPSMQNHPLLGRRENNGNLNGFYINLSFQSLW